MLVRKKKWSVSRQENLEPSLDAPHLYRWLQYLTRVPTRQEPPHTPDYQEYM